MTITRRIMVVDDSPTIRQMLDFTLATAGYEVLLAADGQEALRRLIGEQVDLLVTDLNMPHMNGIGLAHEVRRLPGRRFLPILMLTTESDETIKQSAKQAGVSGWIVKPFKPQQLLHVVRMVLK